MPKPKKKSNKLNTFKELAAETVILKHKLGQAGLFRTMQVMEKVVQEVGWEIDYIITKEKRNEAPR